MAAIAILMGTNQLQIKKIWYFHIEVPHFSYLIWRQYLMRPFIPGFTLVMSAWQGP